MIIDDDELIKDYVTELNELIVEAERFNFKDKLIGAFKKFLEEEKPST